LVIAIIVQLLQRELQVQRRALFCVFNPSRDRTRDALHEPRVVLRPADEPREQEHALRPGAIPLGIGGLGEA
jgi:hypothetical protein